ncbi:hypothetical protein NDU88_004880 [Pleurodeles waltl]|uniref:Uncharacterized protein n=1 Tax=Pleurodeles waltl TaxID=8319 RepID=A0AAV7RMI1_PLEWA|nr:hypothetical protein NDU88_004880 [Pleurodeles waltl]
MRWGSCVSPAGAGGRELRLYYSNLKIKKILWKPFPAVRLTFSVATRVFRFPASSPVPKISAVGLPVSGAGCHFYFSSDGRDPLCAPRSIYAALRFGNFQRMLKLKLNVSLTHCQPSSKKEIQESHCQTGQPSTGK